MSDGQATLGRGKDPGDPRSNNIKLDYSIVVHTLHDICISILVLIIIIINNISSMIVFVIVIVIIVIIIIIILIILRGKDPGSREAARPAFLGSSSIIACDQAASRRVAPRRVT